AGTGLSEGEQRLGEGLAVLPAQGQLGHVGAGIVHLEDLGAEGGLQRVHVVRVALFTDLQQQRVLRIRFLALLDERIETVRGLADNIVVTHQGDVLDPVRDAVGLPLVGEGVHCYFGELLGLGAQLDRVHHTVGNQLARPASALPPSCTGSTTPSVTSPPAQSCAPTITSGPSPVGAWARSPSRMSSKFFSTTSTSTPLSSSKVVTISASASARSSSAQTVSEPEDCWEARSEERRVGKRGGAMRCGV